MYNQPKPAAPGLYTTGGLAKLLRAQEQQYLLQGTTVVAGSASIAVQLERIKSPYYYPYGASFEISFSGAPGAFQVDVQTSDSDTDVSYVSISSVNAVNASNVCRIELTALYALFVRVKVVTLTNAGTVTVTAKVTR